MKTFKRIDIKHLVPLQKKGGDFKRGMSLEAWIATTFLALIPSLALTPSLAVADETNSIAISPLDLTRMTLEELSNIQISTLSKRSEPLDKAPASIFVITREDIRRSGATSIPEILRLAPNLQVARVDSSQYAISARGFNSTTANKLLVLIDGRSVYTPLFSGVFWDVQDLMIENIERIEVISGPGGTLWGANAVNGVINIIRKNSASTQGGKLAIDAGNAEQGAGAWWGGKLAQDASYRLYAKRFNRSNTTRSNGSAVADEWEKGQIGFRTDWENNRDSVTLQGDAYRGSIDQLVNSDKKVSGGNLLARLNRGLENGETLQIQTYFDRTRRDYPGTFTENLHTYDIDLQRSLLRGGNHKLVLGGGYRHSRSEITNSNALAFLPPNKTLSLANVFLQDEVDLNDRFKLTIGARLERNNYTGWEKQPNVRLAWKANEKSVLWSSIAQAVRTPSRIDREFYVPGNSPYSTYGGGAGFVSEKLTAYEIGYRNTPNLQTAFSISTFYNDYDKLRSLETNSSTTVFANMMEGHTHGFETWASYQVNAAWKLKAGYSYLSKNLRLKPGSTDVMGLKAAGNDPEYQFSLRSQMTVSPAWDVDFAVRAVDNLPDPNVSRYIALDAHVGWTISKDLNVSFTALNLLDKRHAEFGPSATGSEIGRAFYMKMLWDF